MKRLFSITLSLLLFAQSLNLDVLDVVQLDHFITHAKFHKLKYGDNLVVFISKHYGELKKQHHFEHQEERKDHENLPFDQQTCTNFINVFVLAGADIYIPKTAQVLDTSTDFFYQESYSQIANSDIFQPPKSA